MTTYNLLVSMVTHLQRHQGVITELVGEFLLYFKYFSRPGVVPERPRHLLVSHGSLVALLLPPQRRHLVLVPGGEAENAGGRRHPRQTVRHAGVLQHLEQEVKESHFPPCSR